MKTTKTSSHPSTFTRNRFGVILRVGAMVKACHPRGGSITGVIKGFELTGDFVRAYGKRVNLIGGMSVAADDCTVVAQIPEALLTEVAEA